MLILSFAHRSFTSYKVIRKTKKGQGNAYCVICCNGNGSDKVPLWVIGKFGNPICFKYKFVHWFDARMTGRKVLLIVDNCPAHPKIYYRRRFYSSILKVTRKDK
ncbi:hypothetical protein Gotur_029344 [Gossypium turneri]